MYLFIYFHIVCLPRGSPGVPSWGWGRGYVSIRRFGSSQLDNSIQFNSSRASYSGGAPRRLRRNAMKRRLELNRRLELIRRTELNRRVEQRRRNT